VGVNLNPGLRPRWQELTTQPRYRSVWTPGTEQTPPDPPCSPRAVPVPDTWNRANTSRSALQPQGSASAGHMEQSKHLQIHPAAPGSASTCTDPMHGPHAGQGPAVALSASAGVCRHHLTPDLLNATQRRRKARGAHEEGSSWTCQAAAAAAGAGPSPPWAPLVHADPVQGAAAR